MNKQNRDGIGKMPPAPSVKDIKNDFNKAVPRSGTQPSATGGGNLRGHNGKTCTEPYTFNY